MEHSDIIQLPVILNKAGNEVMSGPELNRLSPSLLRQAADMMNGTIAYVKYRAVYSPVEGTPLCIHQDCWRPSVENSRCEDHPHG